MNNAMNTATENNDRRFYSNDDEELRLREILGEVGFDEDDRNTACKQLDLGFNKLTTYMKGELTRRGLMSMSAAPGGYNGPTGTLKYAITSGDYSGLILRLRGNGGQGRAGLAKPGLFSFRGKVRSRTCARSRLC